MIALINFLIVKRKDDATNMLSKMSTLMSAMVWTLDDFHGYYLGSNETYDSFLKFAKF